MSVSKSETRETNLFSHIDLCCGFGDNLVFRLFCPEVGHSVGCSSVHSYPGLVLSYSLKQKEESVAAPSFHKIDRFLNPLPTRLLVEKNLHRAKPRNRPTSHVLQPEGDSGAKQCNPRCRKILLDMRTCGFF